MNRRSNYSTNPKSQIFPHTIHFIDHALVLSRVVDDAAFPNFALAYFELRLDERDDLTLLSQQGNDRGQDHGSGDERDIDRRQIELLIKIVRLQVAGIHAFAYFNARIAAQSPSRNVRTRSGSFPARGAMRHTSAMVETPGRRGNVWTDPIAAIIC